MNIYNRIRLLAKSIRAQNRFLAAREFHSIRLFKNTYDFSKLQDKYLSDLYMYDIISRDIINNKISEKINDCELYEDSYMLWKNKGKNSSQESAKKNSNLTLVAGDKIIFPK